MCALIFLACSNYNSKIIIFSPNSCDQIITGYVKMYNIYPYNTSVSCDKKVCYTYRKMIKLGKNCLANFILQCIFYIDVRILLLSIACIIWQLDLQLPVESVPITTNVVSSTPVHGKVYLIQHYVIKFISDLRQVSGFRQFLTPIKLTAII